VSQPSPQSGHYNVEQYLELAECGIISPDDRVELLEGIIVAMAPPSPPLDSSVNRVQYALQRKLSLDVNVRVQSSLVAGDKSAPQPDLAVVPGSPDDYTRRHPSQAHLVVEVAFSSVLQDRITKAAIYARAGIPCYWIVNIRDRCVEVLRDPDRWKGEYTSVQRLTGSQSLAIDAYPDVLFTADELLPRDPVYRED